jgi:hypothetical protein
MYELWYKGYLHSIVPTAVLGARSSRPRLPLPDPVLASTCRPTCRC